MKIQVQPKHAACLIVALLLANASPIASAQPSKTAGGDRLLSAADGRSFVERPSGHRVELPLPAGATVSDFRSTGQDWLIAAVSHVVNTPRLELLQGLDDKVVRLPAPALDAEAELRQPIFIADRAGFQALVWLAGDAQHQLAVKASRWLAGGWGPTETLSPPGKGTQIALTTTVLADGTWLVAWAAFDGRDDEILWTRFQDGAWSPARRLAADNAVPDITPHLFTAGDGALIAWSRFDGNDYRVNVARFDGDRWSTPTVAGPAGSTAPTFSDAERPYVIYRHADPPAWAVMELDTAGGVMREAIDLSANGPWRPVIGTVAEKTIQFEWVGREQPVASAPLSWQKRP